MKISHITESRDSCNVCGQTPCDCTHLAEGTQTVGHEILGMLRQVRRQGHDAMEELYSSCPLLAQFWDQYEGDFRSMVIELSPKTLNRIKAEIAAFNQQGVAKGLNEFAPPGSNDGGDDGFSEETLKRLAAQWYNGGEDPRVERTLMAAGWEIGQDEGYDDEPGVFVVRAGDTNGDSYLSWTAHELKQGVAEGTGDGYYYLQGGIERSKKFASEAEAMAHTKRFFQLARVRRVTLKYKEPGQPAVVVKEFSFKDPEPPKSQMSWGDFYLQNKKQGVAEGKYKCTCHPGDADPDCPVHGLEPMDVGDALDVKEGAEDRKRNALWAQITSYEKRARETKNDIKKQHLLKMADELRGKLPATNEEKLEEVLAALESTIGDDHVGFHVDSERAYQAVMARFGDHVEQDEDSGIMYISSRLWPSLEQVAYDADGIGAQRDDEIENPEHYGVDEAKHDRRSDPEYQDPEVARKADKAQARYPYHDRTAALIKTAVRGLAHSEENDAQQQAELAALRDDVEQLKDVVVKLTQH